MSRSKSQEKVGLRTQLQLESLEQRSLPGGIVLGMPLETLLLTPNLVFLDSQMGTEAVLGTQLPANLIIGKASAAVAEGVTEQPFFIASQTLQVLPTYSANGIGSAENDAPASALTCGLHGPGTLSPGAAAHHEISQTGGGTSGAVLYVTSYGNNSLLSYDVDTQMGTKLQMGNGLASPDLPAVAPDGSIFIPNQGNNSIGRFDVNSGVYSTFVSGRGLDGPSGLAFSADGGSLFVSSQFNSIIFKYDVKTGEGVTFATGVGGNPAGLALSPDGSILYVSDAANIYRFDVKTGDRSTFATGLARPVGLAFARDGSLFVANQNDNTIRHFKVDSGNSIIFPFVRGLNTPEGLAISPDGNSLYVASFGNSTIYKYDFTTGEQSTFAAGGLMSGTIGLAFPPP